MLFLIGGTGDNRIMRGVSRCAFCADFQRVMAFEQGSATELDMGSRDHRLRVSDYGVLRSAIRDAAVMLRILARWDCRE